ncbi:MAG: helix-turn-helix transcriptional regulator [Planctomycetota bacterium]
MPYAKYPLRALQLLGALLASRGPLSTQAIREGVEGYGDASDASLKKRIQRDRALLEEHGIVIESDEDGLRLVRERSFGRPLRLDDEERLALAFLEPLAPRDPALASAFAKMRAQTDLGAPDTLGEHARRYRFDHPSVLSPAARQCAKALASGTCLDIVYVDEAGQETRRRIEPMHLAYHDGSWFCLAWCLSRKDYRNFNTHQMREAKATREPVDENRQERKDDLDLWRRLGAPAFTRGPVESEAEVVFDADVAFMIEAKRWPGTYRTEEGGGLRARIPVRDYEALFKALLPYFTHLHILGPEDFKAHCRDRLMQMKKGLA